MENKIPGKQQSVVVITATILSTGEKVVQELPLTHDSGAPDSALIAMAFQVFRQSGGILVDAEGGTMDFYPLSTIKANFAVKKVLIAFSAPGVH